MTGSVTSEQPYRCSDLAGRGLGARRRTAGSGKVANRRCWRCASGPFGPRAARRVPHDEAEATDVDSLWALLAMLLILEGMLPFVAPKVWRETFRRIGELSDGQIRFMGFACVAAGLVGLLLIQNA